MPLYSNLVLMYPNEGLGCTPQQHYSVTMRYPFPLKSSVSHTMESNWKCPWE